MSARIPTFVLAGSGYVAGELLRLLAGHPRFELAAAASGSQTGERLGAVFPHLAGVYRETRFRPTAELPDLLEPGLPTAIFSAAPHGASAQLVDGLLSAAEEKGVAVKVVDLSADFRFGSVATWQEIYGEPHGAPGRVAEFVCALPEQWSGVPAGHVGHPGCFTTAVLLAAVPLLRAGLIEPSLAVSAVTGSTGAGKKLTATTHHPERRSNLFAYSPLSHRHAPEMELLAGAASGAPVEISFVPQAGPQARGIYATVWATLADGASLEASLEALAAAYAGSPFVELLGKPPELKDVVGSNRCHLSLAAQGRRLVVFSALDNLVKGAAGGGIQWMNRLFGLPEEAGLTLPGPGWF
ncbi:MAG TPA: N-acetyl-gamma-glutamyl-phosphate reductase [Thermoanaerobaculia bacterium]|nr:N-acetyl-gamma-glutamyl-phosphate reductase [Thermoanaerobaculia bacterium]